MKQLKHLRDFLDDEQMKWLPSNLQVRNCILLRQQKEDDNGITGNVLQIFDETGTWIGEITNPDYIPNLNLNN
jgi:hypothetical protein